MPSYTLFEYDYILGDDVIMGQGFLLSVPKHIGVDAEKLPGFAQKKINIMARIAWHKQAKEEFTLAGIQNGVEATAVYLRKLRANMDELDKEIARIRGGVYSDKKGVEGNDDTI